MARERIDALTSRAATAVVPAGPAGPVLKVPPPKPPRTSSKTSLGRGVSSATATEAPPPQYSPTDPTAAPGAGAHPFKSLLDLATLLRPSPSPSPTGGATPLQTAVGLWQENVTDIGAVPDPATRQERVAAHQQAAEGVLRTVGGHDAANHMGTPQSLGGWLDLAVEACTCRLQHQRAARAVVRP